MKLINPPIKLTSEIIVFLFECQRKGISCNEADIQSFLNKTSSYISKGIEFLINNQIASMKDNNLVLSKDFFNKLDDSTQNARVIIKEALSQNKILIEYIHLLSKGHSKENSSKIIKKIYELEQTEKIIQKTLDEWIKILKIKIELTPTINRTFEKLHLSIQNRILAGKFLKEEFGDYYTNLSSNVLKDLSDALTNAKTDTEQSINDLGRALEDFLRIDLNSGLNLSKCQGIAQIANLFNQNGKYPTKLNNLTAGLSSVRSMGKAHGADKKERQRWKLNESTVLSTIIIVISLMKGYLAYIHDGELSF